MSQGHFHTTTEQKLLLGGFPAQLSPLGASSKNIVSLRARCFERRGKAPSCCINTQDSKCCRNPRMQRTLQYREFFLDCFVGPASSQRRVSLDCFVGPASSQRQSQSVIAKPVGLWQSSQFLLAAPPRKDSPWLGCCINLASSQRQALTGWKILKTRLKLQFATGSLFITYVT